MCILIGKSLAVVGLGIKLQKIDLFNKNGIRVYFFYEIEV